jgi:transcriptional regulator with XRE-family HTH domain
MAAKDRDQDALFTFVEELKAYRVDRGWSQADLGTRVNYSEALIAQVESFRKIPTMQLAEALDRLFGTPGYTEGQPGKPGTPGTFMRLATRIRRLSFPVAFRPFTEAEEEATTLLIYEHSFFPGLFQTEAYARAILRTHPHVSEQQVAERLAGRMSRQAIVARDNPPRIWVILSEPVLCLLVGSPETVQDQLMRMVESAQLPNVTVQVLPVAQHAAIQGSFHIAEIDGRSTVAFIADGTDGRTTQDPVTLNEVADRFRYLQSEAMSPSASRDLMERVAKETWSEA